MTVEENLEMGAFLIDNEYIPLLEIYNLFPILKERNQLVGELSGGQRQQVALEAMIKPCINVRRTNS